MHRSPRALALAFPFIVASLASACAEGTDPNLGTSSSSGSSSSSGAGGGGGEGGDMFVPEPDGPPVLTVVNGINDQDAIRLCFVPWPDGGDPAPYPPDTAGLAFAAAARIDSASGVVPADTDVYLHVIAGDLTKTKDLGCAALTGDNPPAGVVAAPIAVVPASALSALRSLLLVPMGCLGGETHTDPLEKVACGPTYAPDAPNPSLLAAAMSRVIEDGSLSLQGAHASQAMPAIDMRILPGIDAAMPAQVAPSLTTGAVGPFPPFRQLSRVEMGSLAQVEIRTFAPGQLGQSSSNPLLPALERGGLLADDLEDGRAFTFVGVGAEPGVPAGPFWHALTWTVVRSDP